jgi:hypothetical protein
MASRRVKQPLRWTMFLSILAIVSCSHATSPTALPQSTQLSAVPTRTVTAQPAPALPTPLPSPTPTPLQSTSTPARPPTPTPNLPATATPRPGTLTPPPDPPRIPIASPFTHRVVENVLIIQLDPNGGTQTWDPFDLAARIGYTQQPPCAAFGLAVAWQVILPYPVPPDLQLSLSGMRQDTTAPLGSGPSGIARVGCTTLTITNQSPYAVRVKLRIAADVAPPY